MSFNPYRSKVSDAEHACEQCKDHMHLVISPKAHNALDVHILSLSNVVGKSIFVCVFHPVLPPSWSWNTQISVFIMKIYPTASRIYLQIQAMCWLQQMAPPGRRLSVGTWILSYLHVTSLSCKLATSFFSSRSRVLRLVNIHSAFQPCTRYIY